MPAREGGPGWVVRLASGVVAWLLPVRDRRLVEELEEAWAERCRLAGRWRADGWYVRQTFGFLARLGPARLGEELRSWAAGAGLRDAVRSSRRRPAWALGVVATLAIGVGGVASVYAVANWVVLRPVPGVTGADELVVLRLGSSSAPPHVSWPVSHRDYEAFREQLTGLGGLAASSPVEAHVRIGSGRAERVAGEVVTANYFEVLGTSLLAGSTFEAGASQQDVIVSRSVALDLAGDVGAALGRTLNVNGRGFRVVGVAPAAFRGPELPGRTELWFPLESRFLLDPGTPRNVAARGGQGVWDRMYGRLRPGETAERIEVAANAAMQRIATSGSATVFVVSHFRMLADAGLGPDPGIRASLRETLTLLGVASVVLLLLAAANVANLAAMEATARRGVTSIRFALGAARRALVSQWFVEAAVLGVAGALGALVIAAALNGAFRSMRLVDFGASLNELRLDARVVLFTLLIGVAASLVAGLPVALSARRTRALSLLGRARHGGAGGARVRSTFVIVQVALSVVLVAGAALMGRTVANLRAADLGFEIDDLILFSIDPALDGRRGEAGLALLDRLESALASHPAIRAAGFSGFPPLAGSYWTAAVYPDGGTQDDDMVSGLARYDVTPGIFGVLDIEGSAALAPGEAVITENLARRLYPELAPESTPGLVMHRPRYRDEGEPPLRIAGVTRNMQLTGRIEMLAHSGLTDSNLTIFLPFDTASFQIGAVTGWVRASAGRGVAVRAIHEVMNAEAPELPVYELMPARTALDRLSGQRVALARVALALGVLGLTLAAVGLYAVLGRSVAERMHELGVRAALGATGGRLLREVAWRGVRLGAAGSVVGSGAALAASQALRAQLFGIDAFDPAMHGIALLLVLGFVVLASALPAIRAMRVSPLSVMREGA